MLVQPTNGAHGERFDVLPLRSQGKTLLYKYLLLLQFASAVSFRVLALVGIDMTQHPTRIRSVGEAGESNSRSTSIRCQNLHVDIGTNVECTIEFKLVLLCISYVK